MSEHVAPQEDRLILPPAWASKLLPRRGIRPGKPVELADPNLVERRRTIDERAEQLRKAIDDPRNEPFAAAVAAFLAGEPDPRGAAAVAALLCDTNRHGESQLRPELDAWVLEHGLPFAVAAAVERLSILEDEHGYHSDSAIETRFIGETDVCHPRHLLRELVFGGIAAVRSLLAAATDAEYAAVVAAVAEHRDTPMKRVAAMILLPDEHDWATEACADYGKARSYAQPDRIVWHSATSPDQLAAAGLAGIDQYSTDTEVVAAALDNLGPAALPCLIAPDPDDPRHSSEFKRLVFRAISLVPTDDAAKYLLERLDRPHVFNAAVDTAERFPVRTLRVAARLARELEGDRRARLAVAAAIPDPGHRAHLDEADRTALDDLLDESGRVPEAAPEELPPLLVAPPWTRKRRKAKPTAIDGLEPPAESHLDWAEGERQQWLAIPEPDDHNAFWMRHFNKVPDLDAYRWRIVPFLAHGVLEKAEPRLDDWTTEQPEYRTDLQLILARWGDRVVDRVLIAPAEDHSLTELPGPILNTDAARIAAERLTRLKAARPSALAWFDRHGLAAVPYLVPDALGADKQRRQCAETALAYLAVRHGAAPVVAASEAFGPEAVAAVAALLDRDPLEPLFVRVPKVGPWAVPQMLPQVLLKGSERALPAEAVRHLITVLALATPDYPYPGLEVVAEACDRCSLTRFSRALFEQWLSVDAPAKDGWALTQLAHFADDVTVWTLAGLVREWPGQSQHQRAVKGLGVLGAIGTETALRAIQSIAEKVKFKALKEEAGRQIDAIAAGLGLSREELADRLVPDFGLGEAIVLDYGPRTFTVAFDERLQPYVTDEDGKPRKALPKPGAKDDPALAHDAYRRFTTLKKELRTVAADKVSRMEAAMVAGRSWSPGDFRRFFTEHPLTRHLARRLVWLAEVDGERFGFRIAEDGTFSDVEDETVEISESARIRVAHPVHLGPEQVAAWAELFADYEIRQPFAQLGRPVPAFTPEELATGRLARFEGAVVETGRILGMDKRGWQRSEVGDGGISQGVSYALPGGGHVIVTLDPGIYAGAVLDEPQQTLAEVRICERAEFWWGEHADPSRPTEIDQVAAAEVLAGLVWLTDAA